MRMSEHKTFHQYSETDPLAVTFIGRVDGYRKNEAYTEIVNKSQESGLPGRAELEHEFSAFEKALKDRDVQVLIPEYVGKFVYDQLTPRDIAVVIGDRLVLCNMVKRSRRYEAAGIFSQIAPYVGEGMKVLVPPNGVYLEGGDIVVDRGKIFVGISQRTNREGFEWLDSVFGEEFEVVALYTKSIAEDEDVLHLDCTFNLVGEDAALIYPGGFREIPEILRSYTHWIEVDKTEQQALATNVLSISKKTVIARDASSCSRVNREMEKIGLEVVEIPFDAAPSTGGAMRCCSLPLVRVP